MLKKDIEVGKTYVAKVSGKLTTVRVDSMGLGGFGKRQHTTYAVTNMATGRRTMFRSAAKFRGKATPSVPAKRVATPAEVANDDSLAHYPYRKFEMIETPQGLLRFAGYGDDGRVCVANQAMGPIPGLTFASTEVRRPSATPAPEGGAIQGIGETYLQRQDEARAAMAAGK